MLNENFVYLAVVINIVGSGSYLIDTLKGRVKPNRVTWLLWAIAPLVAFFAQISEGVGISSLMTFSVGFLPLLIFIASFVNKKSEWKLSRFDIVCGCLSIIGLVLWYITQNAIYAIIFSIIADFLAALPTIVKSYKEPETESSFAFLLATIATILTIFTIPIWDFTHLGFITYILLANVTIYILVQFKIGKRFSY